MSLYSHTRLATEGRVGVTLYTFARDMHHLTLGVGRFILWASPVTTKAKSSRAFAAYNCIRYTGNSENRLFSCACDRATWEAVFGI